MGGDKLTGAQYGVGYKQGNNTLVGYLDYTYKYNSLDELESVKLVLEDYETEINREYDYDELHRVSSITTSYGTAFSHLVEYGYRNRNSTYTTTQISNYTSTVNGTITGYTYTYDQDGNITSITDSAGKVTKYYYDDLQQLTREDNPYYNQTYVYKYDYAGNRTSKEFYGYTTESTISSYPNLTLSYIYEGDRLVRCVGLGSDNTYDGLGNPLTYSTGLSTATFTWQNGRQLATATKGSTSVSYTYNDSGIRTSKIVSGIDHIYTLNGSQIVSESWGGTIVVYLYDENGSPFGMQYRNSTMAEGVFVNFFFEKNLFGDIVAVYNESGIKVISYYYDAWGNHTTTWHNSTGNNTYAQYNPFRYRGYYYDTETQFYYLQSRYYDPVTGRFLNADSYINANGDLIGFNMYAYCSNNPVMYLDPTGMACECLTKRVHGNHICNSDEKDFLAAYYEAVGNNYNLNGRTVTHKTITRYPFEVFTDNLIIGVTSFLITSALRAYGIPIPPSYDVLSLFTSAAAGTVIPPAGEYDVYSITETTYYYAPVEVANYHGYRQYQDKEFKKTKTEIYYFFHGQIYDYEVVYTDDYLAYQYRNHP